MDGMDRVAPRRRPPSGGYARGDVKRMRIVEAALRRFGEDGFEKASTRQIALDAGVNPPALQYYFDGKSGLHMACAEYMAERFGLAMQDSYERADAAASRGEALEALCGLIDALADYFFAFIEADGWSSFIARGQGEEGNRPAYETIRKRLGDELYSHCDRLVGLIIGAALDDPRTRIRSMAIMGQLKIFHLGRAMVLERLGWPDLKGPRLAMLKEVLLVQTRACLASLAEVAE